MDRRLQQAAINLLISYRDNRELTTAAEALEKEQRDNSLVHIICLGLLELEKQKTINSINYVNTRYEPIK